MKLLKLLRSFKSLLKTVTIVNDFTVGTNHPSINYLVRVRRRPLLGRSIPHGAKFFLGLEKLANVIEGIK